MNPRAFLIRRLFFPLASLRMGNRFAREYEALRESQWRSSEQLRDLQSRRLRDLLRHAFQTVPFYRQSASDHGLSPDKFTESEALQSLPVLSKREIREIGPDAFVSSGIPSPERIPYSTSGSTGEPFSFFVDRGMVGNKIARYFREMTAWGIEPGTPFLKLWGHGRVSTTGTEDEQSFFTKWILRRREASAFDLDEERASQLLYLLRKQRLPVLEAYTSAAHFLAQCLRDGGGALPDLKVVVVSGETLAPEQERLIGEAFEARVINAYGSREFGRVAFSCPEGEGLHFSSEDFFAEYLDLDPPDAGGLKRLVLTCFANRAQPFIRYDTGDLVLSSSSEACGCGRGLPLWRKVEGRLAERFLAPSGRHVSVHFLTLLLEDFGREIRQFQAVAEPPSRLSLLVVPTPEYREMTGRFLRDKILEHVGSEMEVAVSCVEEIAVTGDGKRPLLRVRDRSETAAK